MNAEDTKLKLQAGIDGELSQEERVGLERLIASNPEGHRLTEGLTAIRTLLRENKPEHAVPETREFYFSKIARQIESETRKAELKGAPATQPATFAEFWFGWARKHFVGLSGVGLAACLAIVLFAMPGGMGGRDGELELASDDMGAYTFRDQQQEVTMVWLYDRKAEDSEFTDAVRGDIEEVE
jgi:anti-sigma factor RsiW